MPGGATCSDFETLAFAGKKARALSSLQRELEILLGLGVAFVLFRAFAGLRLAGTDLVVVVEHAARCRLRILGFDIGDKAALGGKISARRLRSDRICSVSRRHRTVRRASDCSGKN